MRVPLNTEAMLVPVLRSPALSLSSQDLRGKACTAIGAWSGADPGTGEVPGGALAASGRVPGGGPVSAAGAAG
ncbi:MAG: hypothetical protein OHK0048_11620 [Rhodoferax sp.]